MGLPDAPLACRELDCVTQRNLPVSEEYAHSITPCRMMHDQSPGGFRWAVGSCIGVLGVRGASPIALVVGTNWVPSSRPQTLVKGPGRFALSSCAGLSFSQAGLLGLVLCMLVLPVMRPCPIVRDRSDRGQIAPPRSSPAQPLRLAPSRSSPEVPSLVLPRCSHRLSWRGATQEPPR